MQLNKAEYAALVKKASPHSAVGRNCVWAFAVGGCICTVGEGLRQWFLAAGYTLSDASLLASVGLIFLSAVTTALGWYQKLASRGGAGTLVPITGFANSIVSPAMEFKSEGYIMGIGAKMFSIAGPVLAYGISAAVFYGLVLCLFFPG